MARHVAIYRLEKPPFSTCERSGLVLATGPLCHAADRIRSDLEGDAPWICVSGASGMGKTSLLRVLPRMLGQGFRCAVLHASRGQCSGSDLETSIAGALGLEGGSLSRESLMSLRQGGPRLILLVDDADRLGPQALQRLATLREWTDADGKALLQVVATADLDRSERQGWSPLVAWTDPLWIVRLTPLLPDSLHAYLEKRMKHAGWRGKSLFSETGALAIHRRTGGNPGAVSRLCSELLDRACADGAALIDAGFVLRDLPPAPPPATQRIPTLLDAVLAKQPLTAESILAAPSLDLADPPPAKSGEGRGRSLRISDVT